MTTNRATPTAGEQQFLDDLVKYIAEIHGPSIVVDKMVGIKEIAATLNVKPSTVCNWAYRRFDNNFPDVVIRLGATPIYDITEVVSWYIHWQPRTGRKVGKLPVGDFQDYLRLLRGE